MQWWWITSSVLGKAVTGLNLHHDLNCLALSVNQGLSITSPLTSQCQILIKWDCCLNTSFGTWWTWLWSWSFQGVLGCVSKNKITKGQTAPLLSTAMGDAWSACCRWLQLIQFYSLLSQLKLSMALWKSRPSWDVVLGQQEEFDLVCQMLLYFSHLRNGKSCNLKINKIPLQKSP